MTSEFEEPAPARTTNAGLEAWLAGTNAESAGPVAGRTRDRQGVDQAIGLVNLAEGLALEAPSSARSMAGPDGAELIVDPDRSAYYFESSSLKPLSAILLQSASHWTPVPAESMAAIRAKSTPQPLDRLRFYAGLIATPGILTRKLGRDARFQLARWPETEREFPRHFRIATAMLSRSATVDEIIAAAGATRDEVVDYVNASFAAGRLQAPDPSRGHLQRNDSPHARPGLRLIARLSRRLTR